MGQDCRFQRFISYLHVLGIFFSYLHFAYDPLIIERKYPASSFIKFNFQCILRQNAVFFVLLLFICLFYSLSANYSQGLNFFFWNYSLPKLSSTVTGPVTYASSSSRPYFLDLPRIQLVS